MPANDSPANSDPCGKCGGLLVLEEDRDGKYLRCMQCGTHDFIDEKAEERECPRGDDAEQKCAWRPVRDQTMHRHRQLREAIVREGLSPAEARERFGVSRSTYYRVVDGQRPSG